MTIGETLRRKLLQAQVTQEQLADNIQVSRLTINQIINGQRRVTPEMSILLGSALNMSPRFFWNKQAEEDYAEATVHVEKRLHKIRRVL